jgi:O-antigen/teichoic acid export membrane protein/glycosyltransferase involved in cell wall biosynthesis
LSRSVATDSWVIYGSRLVSVGLTFLTVLAIARAVGPRGTGEYAVGVAAAGILIQVGNAGLSTAALYFAARRPRRAGGILTLAWAWSAVVLLLGTLVSPWLVALGLDRGSAILVSIWAGLQMALLFHEQLLLASRQFSQSGAVQVFRRSSIFVLTIVAVAWAGGGVRNLFGAAVFGETLAILLSAVLLARRGVLPRTFPLRGLRSFVALGMRAFPVLLLPFLLFRSDILLLKIWRGPQETGVYAIAAQIIDAVLLLPAAFGGVLFVSMSGRRADAREVAAGVRRVLWPVCLLSAGIALTAPWLVPALFGRSFEPAYAMVLLLLPGAIAIAAETQFAQYFARQGFPWFLAAVWTGGFAGNLALNLYAIPRFGGLGAAVTSTVAYMVVTAVVMRRFLAETGTRFRDLLRAGPRVAGTPDPAREDHVLISFFPLSKTDAGGEEIAASEKLALASLRVRRSADWWAELRRPRRRATFVLTARDDRGQRTLAHVVLLLVRAKEKDFLHADPRRTEPFRRTRAAASLVRLAVGTAFGAMAAARNFLDAKRMAVTPTRPRPRPQGTGVAYLRSSVAMPTIGGSVGHARGVISRLCEAGQAVTVFASTPPCSLPPGARFHPVAGSGFVSPSHELNLHSHARRYHRHVRHAIAADVSFLYQRYVLNDLSGVRLAAERGVPLVLEFNGSEVWVARHWSRRLRFESVSTAIEAVCLRGADLVVTVSRALGDEALRQGVSPRRLLVYPNGVDAGEFDPSRFGPDDVRRTRAGLGVPRDCLLITHVGTFAAWHGTEVLARAIREIPAEVAGRPLHFLFVGDGLRAEATRALLADEILKGRVTMAGARPASQTPGILAASDVLVSPQTPNEDGSPFFGSPTKLFEYMAMARIVVASDLEQPGEVLRGWVPDGRPSAGPSGLLVPAGDAPALARVLRQAATLSTEQAAELSLRARRQVLNAFTWEHHVAAILERLRELDEGARCAAA